MRHLLLSLLLLALASPLAAATPKPEDTLNQAVARIHTTLQKKHDHSSFNRLFAELFDFQDFARRCLGEDWEKQSKADRNRYVKLLQSTIAASYMPRIDSVPAEFALTIEKTDRNKDEATVHTLGTGGGKKVPLEFRMHLVHGKWTIYDTSIDGVGLVESYHEQFSKLLAKGGMPELLSTLEARRAALESKKP